MDNHIMYYSDADGELELRRCCLCSWMHINDGMHCTFGYECSKEECDRYEAVQREKMLDRISEIKKMKKSKEKGERKK